MARLFLHIGAHKTGTTFLQQTLDSNRICLARAGIAYPRVWPNRAHHVLAAPWQAGLVERTGVTPGKANRMWQDLIERHAEGPATVLLSAENFTRCGPEAIEPSELAELLAPFEQVEILYTVREQIGLFQAIYQQVTRDADPPPPFDRLLRQALEHGQATGVDLDHGRIVRRYGSAGFPVRVVDYATLRADPQAGVRWVLDQMGLPALPVDFQWPAQRSNVSDAPLAQKILLELRPDRKVEPESLAAIRAILDEFTGHQMRSCLLSEREFEDLKAVFSELNRVEDEDVGVQAARTIRGLDLDLSRAPLMRERAAAQLRDFAALRLARTGIIHAPDELGAVHHG